MNAKQLIHQKSWARREAKWKREGRKREKERRNSEDDQQLSEGTGSLNQPKSLLKYSSQIHTTSEAEGPERHDLPPTYADLSSTSDSSTSSSSSSSSSSSESDKESSRKADSPKSKAESSVDSTRDEISTGNKQDGKLSKSFEIDFGEGFASGTDASGDGFLDRSKEHDSTEKVLPVDSDFDLDDLDNEDQIVHRKGQRRRRRRKYRDDKAPFVLEIDDETDEDFLSVLLDKNLPEGIRMCTSQTMPEFGTGLGSKPHQYTDGQMVMSMLRFQWKSSALRGTRSNQFFSSLFQELFAKLCSQLDGCSPAVVCGVRTQVNLTPDDMIELICTGKVIVEKTSTSLDGKLDSDSTLLEEIELRKKEDLEQRKLSKEIEKGALLLSSTAPSISQSRATVIVDILSDNMKQLHRSQAHQEANPVQLGRSSTSTVTPLLVSTTMSPEPPSEPSSPDGELKSIPFPLPMSPRTKSEGRPRVATASPSTALALIRSVPIGHFAPSLKHPTPPKVTVASATAIMEVPVELTPLHYINDASVRSRSGDGYSVIGDCHFLIFTVLPFRLWNILVLSPCTLSVSQVD